MIIYHGWGDAGMSALASTNYYDNIATTIGPQDTQSFVRLYMAPGMHHCFGGPGPDSFGQLHLSVLGTKTWSTNLNPEFNISAALEQWVIKGISPGPIVATKYVNDLDPAQGIKMTRPICPYPQIAKYKEDGDTNKAANFICVQENNQ